MAIHIPTRTQKLDDSMRIFRFCDTEDPENQKAVKELFDSLGEPVPVHKLTFMNANGSEDWVFAFDANRFEYGPVCPFCGGDMHLCESEDDYAIVNENDYVARLGEKSTLLEKMTNDGFEYLVCSSCRKSAYRYVEAEQYHEHYKVPKNYLKSYIVETSADKAVAYRLPFGTLPVISDVLNDQCGDTIVRFFPALFYNALVPIEKQWDMWRFALEYNLVPKTYEKTVYQVINEKCTAFTYAKFKERVTRAADMNTNAEVAADYGLGQEEFCKVLETFNVLERGEDGNWHPTQAMIDAGFIKA